MQRYISKHLFIHEPKSQNNNKNRRNEEREENYK